MKKVYTISELQHIDREEIRSIFGERSWGLMRLLDFSGFIGKFVVPRFTLTPISYSRTHEIVSSASENPFKISEGDRSQLAHSISDEVANEILSIFNEAPIIRGTSQKEGAYDFSFAGVCQSYIPKKDISTINNIKNGIATVLLGPTTQYSQYYFKQHGFVKDTYDVGIICMDFVSDPQYHITAYVTQHVIALRGFCAHGNNSMGGFEIVFDRNGKDQNDNHLNIPNMSLDMFDRLMSSLMYLSDHFYVRPQGVDVELLIDEHGIINIVQIRKLCISYVNSVQNAYKFRLSTIESGHIPFSVGQYSGPLRDAHKDAIVSNCIYYVYHNGGFGTFKFLKSIGSQTGIVLFVIHRRDSFTHDHTIYSLLEDERIQAVFHVFEDEVGMYKGKIINVFSSGWSMLLYGSMDIIAITEGNIPDDKDISAVFFIGYNANGNLLVVRNERGWDIPGGHVEHGDGESPINALSREVKEEAGATVISARPVLYLQSGRPQVMVFYTGTYELLDEYILADDSEERDEIDQALFITKYYGDKDLMTSILSLC